MRQHKYTVKASTTAKAASKRRERAMSGRSRVFASATSYKDAWNQVAAGVAKKMDKDPHISDTSVRYVRVGDDHTTIQFDFKYNGREDDDWFYYPEGGWEGFTFDPNNIPGMIDFVAAYELDSINYVREKIKAQNEERRRLGIKYEDEMDDYDQDAFEDDVFEAIGKMGAVILDASTQAGGRVGTYTISYQGAEYTVDASEVYDVIESSFEYGVDDDAVTETAEAILALI